MTRNTPLVLAKVGYALPAAAALALLLGTTAPAEARRVCAGDCSGDGTVTVDEVLRGINVALGVVDPADCHAFDADGSADVDVAEIVTGIDHALGGCPLVTVADAAFWQTLWADADRAEESLALHTQAIADDPADSRSYFLRGMMHLFRYGQSIANFTDFDDFARSEIVRANDDLDRAVELAPANRSYPGFRGAATYQNGVTHGDAELEQLGTDQLRASMELWPIFNRFSFLGTVAAVVEPDDPLFDEAMAHFLDLLSPAGLAMCTGEICGNAGRAPRNLEGSGILFGDIFAKAGNLPQARNWYQLAVGSGRSSSWRFTPLAEARLATVTERVAAYADDDPGNDPPLVGLANESCLICHAR